MAQQSEYRKPSGRPPMRLGSLMIRVALILLCLVMISIHLMGGMYAKYTTKGSGGDDARVAKFDVDITGDPVDLVVSCTENPQTGTYKITVDNISEVAVRYTISVTTDIAAGSLYFDKSAVNAVLDVDKGALPVSGTGTHELTFTVNDWSAITQSMSGDSGEITLNFTVTIDVVQVD